MPIVWGWVGKYLAIMEMFCHDSTFHISQENSMVLRQYSLVKSACGKKWWFERGMQNSLHFQNGHPKHLCMEEVGV